MVEHSSVIKLDWDAISWNECKRRISIMKKHHYVKSIEVRMSPINGYHIYVCLFFFVHERTTYRLRRMWKDDPKRLMMDVFYRDGTKDNCDVMFTMKLKHEIIWPEIPLFFYHRNMVHTVWQVMDLQESAKKSQRELQASS